jgi:hypothetical protein
MTIKDQDEASEIVGMSPSDITKAFFSNPHSRRTAVFYSVQGAIECIHGRQECFLRCAVRKTDQATGIAKSTATWWAPIPEPERDEWLKRALVQAGAASVEPSV